MCYILYMNKDVIYIEPEDDITDIITKIENSKEKIVALVPPKKAGVFHSVVNIKLIAKAGAGAEKTVVLVTTDPSIVKLAALTKMPVTKNLQSAPAIPQTSDDEEIAEEEGSKEEISEEKEEENKEDDIEEKNSKELEEDINEEEEDEKEKNGGNEEVEEAKSDNEKTKKDKKGKFLANAKNPFLVWVREHKKLVGFLSAGFIILILVGIWAFVIAPAVTITLGIRTTTNNFLENVTFTQTLTEEDASVGKFYLTEYKIEEKSEKEFEATGKKNVGEKASGSVVVYAYFEEKGSVAIDAGATFTNNGLTYVSTSSSSLSWDGSDTDVCDNKDNASSLIKSGCQISGRIAVTATNPGSSYNIAASSTGWSTTANVGVYSDAAMSGGTDKTVTIVQQSDVDKALSEISLASEDENREKLFETIPEDAFIIDSSFTQTVGDAVSTPAVGEEVEEGKKALLTVTTTDTVFTIDKTKVEEFITEKAKLADGFKIYSINDPFIENFLKTDTGYAGKLKTSFVAGPKVTENDVIEIVKGKGLGTAQHDLNDVDGIGSIRIDASFPWVTSVPNNPEKITVVLDVGE
jgi:flagellar motility protein MotE (MotC chaperone)